MHPVMRTSTKNSPTGYIRNGHNNSPQQISVHEARVCEINNNISGAVRAPDLLLFRAKRLPYRHAKSSRISQYARIMPGISAGYQELLKVILVEQVSCPEGNR